MTLYAQPSKKILRYGADASSGAPYVFQNPKNIRQLIDLYFQLTEQVSEKNLEKVFDAIGFNMGEYLELINGSNKKLDIVYSIDYIVYLTFYNIIYHLLYIICDLLC